MNGELVMINHEVVVADLKASLFIVCLQ